MESRCGHYVGPGYVSNWGIQNNGIRCRRRTIEAPPCMARKYVKSGTWTESEIKKKRYKPYEMKDGKRSIRRGIGYWLKKKTIHEC
ncbi:hypothetical protein SESBI_45898 [Sesbania bispinosa]|nr:hypothetical protein SESBI_45898 [Sesbania bispinosa]